VESYDAAGCTAFGGCGRCNNPDTRAARGCISGETRVRGRAARCNAPAGRYDTGGCGRIVRCATRTVGGRISGNGIGTR
jgi:hypothetical protein